MKYISLKKNFMMNMAHTVSAIIFPVITFPYIFRVLLPEGTGKVGFAVAFVAYFNMFAQLGIPMYGIKACARIRDNRRELTRTVHELVFINVVMALISYIILAVAVISIPRLRDEKLLYVISSLTVFLSAIGMEWLYKGLEEYTYITLRSLAFKFIAIIAMFLLVKQPGDYAIYAATLVFATGASNLLNLINSHKYIDFKWIGNYNIRRHLRIVLVFFALACTTTIYTNLDNVMLGFMKTDIDVGYYNAAVKIKVVLVGLITSLGAVLLPRASYYVEKGELDRFRKISAKAMHFVILAALPVVVYFVTFAAEVIKIIAGDAFAGSVLPMQIIMPAVLLIGVTNLLGIEILVPTGRESIVLKSTIAGAVTDIVLNIILIPKYAAAGAAVGTLVAEAVVAVYQIVAAHKDFKEAVKEIPIIKILIALALAFIAAGFVRTKSYTTVKTLMYSAVGFFVMYGVTLVVLKDKLIDEFAAAVNSSSFFNAAARRKVMLVAFMAYIVIRMSRTTIIVTGNPLLATVFTALCLVMLGVEAAVITFNYYSGLYSKKFIFAASVITAFIVASVYMSKNGEIAILWLFILAAIDTDYDTIIETSAVVHISIVALVVLLAETGILPTMSMGRGDGTVRHFLGFNYTTTAPNFLFYTTLMWIYWRREKISWLELGALASADIYLFLRTDTKSAFALTAAAVSGAVLLKAVGWLREYKKTYGFMGILFLIVFPLGFMYVSLFSDMESDFIVKLNDLVSGRVGLGRAAFIQYGIKPFGQYIKWVTNNFTLEKLGPYNFVDSSYLNVLFTYGYVILSVILVYLAAMLIRGMKRKDTYMMLILSLLFVHTAFDTQLIEVQYNAFLLALSYGYKHEN